MNQIVQVPVIPLVDLTISSCRWPIGDPQEDDFGFCGATSAADRPYCDQHCLLAYGRVPPPRLRPTLIAQSWSSMRADCGHFEVYRPRRRRVEPVEDSGPTTVEEIKSETKARLARFEASSVAEGAPRIRQTKRELADQLAELGVQLEAEKQARIAERERHEKETWEQIRVAAFAATQDALRSVARPSVRKIIHVVSEAFNVTPLDILSHRRQVRVVLPRHVAVYLARMTTELSLPQIGRQFGGRDHTTQMSAILKIERMMGADADFRARVEALRISISGEEMATV